MGQVNWVLVGVLVVALVIVYMVNKANKPKGK